MISAKTLKVKSTYYLTGNPLNLRIKEMHPKNNHQLYANITPTSSLPLHIMDEFLHTFKIQIILKVFNSILMHERKVIFCQLCTL